MKGLCLLFGLLVSSLMPALSQSSLDQAIAAKFPLTKATADRSDIVTAGSVMTLKKDGVLMYATTANAKSNLVYKDGKVSTSGFTKITGLSFGGHSASNIVQRTYVAGEKVWLIEITGATDGVVLQLLSDPVGDVRYTTYLKFPFAKGSNPKPEDEIALIGQVLEPASDAPEASAKAAPAPAAAPAAPPPAPMPDIPPPPPPPDQPAAAPPTLEKGQTKDQVVAMFGQPTKVVKTGTKEIDFYKDMKVTYVNGKVTDVQ